MIMNYSACYYVPERESFTSEYFSDKRSAANLARKMSKQTPGHMAYVHKNTGDWINGLFYAAESTTAAVYVNGKRR